MKHLLTLVLAMSLVGCSNDEPAVNGTPNNETPNNETPNNETPNNETPNNEPTAMMLPVDLQQQLDQNCLSCHGPGGIGGYDFTEIDTVVAVGELIATVVENRTMPPWNADPTCADLKGSLRLSDEQIAIFSDWVDAGKPLVPEAPFERLAAINPEIGDEPDPNDEVFEAQISEPYKPVFGRADEYEQDDFRCFVVDPGFTETRQLTGFEVLPDNLEVAHHMVVFTADGSAENRAAIAALEAEDPEPGFSCFGISGFEATSLSAVWAPGGGRVGFPRQQGIGQTAVEIEAGSLIIMQMHYNQPEDEWSTDQSGIRLWLRPEGEPVHELAQATWSFIGNLPFRIPAGVDGTMVPDDECDVVYDRYVLDGSNTPISRPAVGFDEDEVECGIEREDCEAEFGVGATECEYDYGSRLRINAFDPAATYTVTVAGTDIAVDGAAIGAASAEDVLSALAQGINDDLSLQPMVTATLRDRDADQVMDEVVVSNTDSEAIVRTEAFVATGTAEVWRGFVEKCAQFDPARLAEARLVGSSGCVQKDMYYRNTAPLTLWAVFSHMHLLGNTIEMEIVDFEDDGTVSTPIPEDSECAARVDWDFNWQRTYWYEQPKRLPREGMIRLRCRWDISDATEEVRLGDGSNAEMCIALLYLTI